MVHSFSTRRERDRYGSDLHKTPEYASNPHLAILNFISAHLEDIRLSADKLLVATYRRPEQTEGGLILTDSNLNEDKFQGVAGLVLKVGDAAFKDDSQTTFCGFRAEPTEWVTFRAVNGVAREIAGLHCRIIQDIHVDAVIKDPTLVW